MIECLYFCSFFAASSHHDLWVLPCSKPVLSYVPLVLDHCEASSFDVVSVQFDGIYGQNIDLPMVGALYVRDWGLIFDVSNIGVNDIFCSFRLSPLLCGFSFIRQQVSDTNPPGRV